MQKKSGIGGSKRTVGFVNYLKAKIAKDPTTSVRRLASDMNVVPATVRKSVREDLGLKSNARTLRHRNHESEKSG